MKSVVEQLEVYVTKSRRVGVDICPIERRECGNMTRTVPDSGEQSQTFTHNKMDEDSGAETYSPGDYRTKGRLVWSTMVATVNTYKYRQERTYR